MNGLQAYHALKVATADLTQGDQFTVNTIDAIDLAKLSVSDLESRGYDNKVAERVSKDLLAGSLRELGASMGVRLFKDSKAPRLDAKD